jgi:DNA-binding GntR family transcriptional regulator
MRLKWQHLRRSIGEVLRNPDTPSVFWHEHSAVLEAKRHGDAANAAGVPRGHVVVAFEQLKAASAETAG